MGGKAGGGGVVGVVVEQSAGGVLGEGRGGRCERWWTWVKRDGRTVAFDYRVWMSKGLDELG